MKLKSRKAFSHLMHLCAGGTKYW